MAGKSDQKAKGSNKHARADRRRRKYGENREKCSDRYNNRVNAEREVPTDYRFNGRKKRREALPIRHPRNVGHPLNPAFNSAHRRKFANMVEWLDQTCEALSTQVIRDRMYALVSSGHTLQEARDAIIANDEVEQAKQEAADQRMEAARRNRQAIASEVAARRGRGK